MLESNLTPFVLVLYVLAALWGTADAIWQTQINALYGVLFANDEEAAFSNYRLWESLGTFWKYLELNVNMNLFRLSTGLHHSSSGRLCVPQAHPGNILAGGRDDGLCYIGIHNQERRRINK